MTAKDLISFVRTRKGVTLSVLLHVLVVGWGLVSFSARSLEAPPPEDVVPVDIVSDDNVAKAMKGMKDGKKENQKAMVEKVAEAKPVDDVVGKISTKQPVVADSAPPPTPKTEEKPVEKKPDPPKPVEKKPDPPKPVAETKPKEETKADEKKPEEKKPDQPKPDPIADALKKDEKKQKQLQAQAAVPPAPPKPKADRVFDQSKIAALLDKRDPTRQAVTGAEMNSKPALGTAQGTAAANSATWTSAFRAQVERCWKKPYGGIDQQKTVVSFDIKLKRDGTLESMPAALEAATTPYMRAYQESAMRAIIACQPYNLPATMFDDWRWFNPVFTERDS